MTSQAADTCNLRDRLSLGGWECVSSAHGSLSVGLWETRLGSHIKVICEAAKRITLIYKV